MEQEGTRGNRKEFDDVVCGGVVQLVRTPACHAGGRGFSPVAPAIRSPAADNSAIRDRDVSGNPIPGAATGRLVFFGCSSCPKPSDGGKSTDDATSTRSLTLTALTVHFHRCSW